jgi:hypothetical protein
MLNKTKLEERELSEIGPFLISRDHPKHDRSANKVGNGMQNQHRSLKNTTWNGNTGS